jgi:hypothetical protein
MIITLTLYKRLWNHDIPYHFSTMSGAASRTLRTDYTVKSRNPMKVYLHSVLWDGDIYF